MKKIMKIIVPLLLAALIIASVGWYLLVYDRSFTQDMLLQQARYHDTNGNKSLSSFFYDLAYEFNEQDQNVAIELANQYKADGNYTKAEYTLVNAIADGPTVELYVALCNTYVEQNKMLDAVNMLDSISNKTIKGQLDAMRPAVPSADYESGLYSEYIAVSLSSGSGIGTIYYTLNGDFPSQTTNVFVEPIALPLGETTIRSLCVGENGLVSPLGSISYTIGGVVELVEFADPAFEAAIRQMLSTGETTGIYTSQLWEITEFTYPEDAAVYTDLAYLTNLKSLTFTNMNLDTLSCLEGLSALETLSFTNCNFPAGDLTVLAALPSLQKLTMDGCGLTTIAGLEGAQRLTYLDLDNNTLRNLEVLSGMTTLQELYLAHNAVTSLAALSTLENLAVLDVSYNSVTDISPLTSCIRMQSLNLVYNQLTSLAGVDKLVCLTTLKADHNQLSDVSVLGSCSTLVELTISNNAIADISDLANLTALETLDFSYNEVKELPKWTDGALRTVNGAYNELENIDILANLPQLSYVYMDYNDISSVDALADCYYLVLVNIYGNPVSDVSALTAHSIIVNYDPTA